MASTLSQQLDEFMAGWKQRVPPERQAVMERHIAHLKATGLGQNARQVGDRAPADIITPYPIAVADPVQTERPREIEAGRLVPVVRFQPTASRTALADLAANWADTRQRFLTLLHQSRGSRALPPAEATPAPLRRPPSGVPCGTPRRRANHAATASRSAGVPQVCGYPWASAAAVRAALTTSGVGSTGVPTERSTIPSI